jgi:hypothetical protein
MSTTKIRYHEMPGALRADVRWVNTASDGDRKPRWRRVHEIRFPSLPAMMHQAQVERPWDEDTKYNRDDEWVFGSHGCEGTDDILRTGIAPSDKCREIYRELNSEITARMGLELPMEECQSARRKHEYDWVGGFVHPIRHLESTFSDQPIPVFDSVTNIGVNPIIKIGVNVCVSWGNSEKTFGRMSAMAACLCERLTALGYGVEIWGMMNSTKDGTPSFVDGSKNPDGSDNEGDPDGGNRGMGWGDHNVVIMWPMKGGHEPLDVERIMSVGVPGLFRRYCFQIQHSSCSAEPGYAIETTDYVREAVGLDTIVETSWGEGGGQCDKVMGILHQLVGKEHGEEVYRAMA